MKKLFLDDMRPAPLGWDLVKNYDEFVSYIETNGCPDVVSFDHDLGFEHYPLGEQNPGDTIPYDTYEEKTGYHCAKYMRDKGLFPELVIVHSWNIVGRSNIAFVFEKHTKVLIQPYIAGTV